MTQTPLVKSVMTPFPWSIEADESLAVARERMAAHDIRHLPVKDGDRIVGILSDRELRLVGGPADELTAREACDREPLVVDLTEPLEGVLARMVARHLDAAIVVKDGRLAGIFTSIDACRSFGHMLHDYFPSGGGDVA